MSAAFGVECPLCHRRVVTTEAPCECGFRFPRGYDELEVPLSTDDWLIHCLEVATAQATAANEKVGAMRAALVAAQTVIDPAVHPRTLALIEIALNYPPDPVDVIRDSLVIGLDDDRNEGIEMPHGY